MKASLRHDFNLLKFIIQTNWIQLTSGYGNFFIHLFKIAKYAKAMAYYTMLMNFLDSLESHQIICQFWFLHVMLNHIEFLKINIRLFSCTARGLFRFRFIFNMYSKNCHKKSNRNIVHNHNKKVNRLQADSNTF